MCLKECVLVCLRLGQSNAGYSVMLGEGWLVGKGRLPTVARQVDISFGDPFGRPHLCLWGLPLPLP